MCDVCKNNLQITFFKAIEFIEDSYKNRINYWYKQKMITSFQSNYCNRTINAKTFFASNKIYNYPSFKMKKVTEKKPEYKTEDKPEKIANNSKPLFKRLIYGILALVTFITALFGNKKVHTTEKKVIFQTANDNFEPLRPELKDLVQEVNIKTKDNLHLKSWYIPAQDGKPTVLYCHGIKTNITHYQEVIKMLTDIGVGVLMPEYRGFGWNKEGTPTEKNLYEDVNAASQFLNNKGINNKSIIIAGNSLGGALAVDRASKDNYRGLVIINTMSSMKSLLKSCLQREFFPVEKKLHKAAIKVGKIIPESLLPLHVQFNTEKKFSKIQCPILIAHNINDQLMPFEMAAKLNEMNPNAELYLSHQGGHREMNHLADGIIDFIKKLGTTEFKATA